MSILPLILVFLLHLKLYKLSLFICKMFWNSANRTFVGLWQVGDHVKGTWPNVVVSHYWLTYWAFVSSSAKWFNTVGQLCQNVSRYCWLIMSGCVVQEPTCTDVSACRGADIVIQQYRPVWHGTMTYRHTWQYVTEII